VGGSRFRGNDDRREGKTQNEIFIAPQKELAKKGYFLHGITFFTTFAVVN
jgi:hypothetical protein